MAARAAHDPKAELMQIVLLTLCMTGGGLMLFFLVMNFYLLPSRASEAETAAKQYEALSKFLLSSEMQDLRAQARDQAEARQQKQSLTEIIDERRQAFGVEFSSNRTRSAGTTKAEIRLVDLKPTDLARILQFVVAVADARNTIAVEKLTLTPSRGSTLGGDDKSWTANITFVDFAPSQGSS